MIALFHTSSDGQIVHDGSDDMAPCGTKDYPSIRLVVINEFAFIRNCITKALSDFNLEVPIISYDSICEWKSSSHEKINPIILLSIYGQPEALSLDLDDIEKIRSFRSDARIIVVSNIEAPENLSSAFARGIRGYIPESSSIDIAAAAIRLVLAGGTFIPAAHLLSKRCIAHSGGMSVELAPFTQRQLDVIERLRKGEPNKIIAYKLQMEECTVKVHIRNIMQKIKARNRTEVAYLTNQIFIGKNSQNT